MKLYYDRPADEWVEALPIGNGRLGGMVFGGARHEKIMLNEESLWSGWFDSEADNPDCPAHLDEIRRAIFSGDYATGERLTYEHMVCRGKGSGGEAYGTYQIAGEMLFDFPSVGSDIADYSRTLDLESGLVTIVFQSGGVRHERCVFTSLDDGVISARYTADAPFDVRFSFSHQSAKVDYTPSSFSLGHAIPSSEAFAVFGTLAHDGGSAEADGDGISFTGVTSLTITADVRTGYVKPDRTGLPKPESDPKIPLDAAKSSVLAVAGTFNERLTKSAHILSSMINRATVQLDGISPDSDMPTNERITAVRGGTRDAGLELLYFTFGKYLLICSSYNCHLPANLQGIWSDGYVAPWSADYHININIQMNYWLAETCGMPELIEPFLGYIRFIAEHGSRTARVQYNARGWVAHTVTNPWGFTAPGEGASWGSFMCAGAWCCMHIWERYLFSGDANVLRENFDVLCGASEFFLDYLVTDPRTGYLVTCPSNSPENSFTAADGKNYSICAAPAIDNQIIRELFTMTYKSCEILGDRPELAAELKEKINRLAPIAVGKHGQIMEWSEDFDEPEPGHRHISQLFALFPAAEIDPSDEKLMNAARATLNRRLSHGGGHTGWSKAWITLFFARLGDGAEAAENLRGLIGNCTLPNMFDNHPPFQIDGNFGGCAAVAEMLLQSHGKDIILLPALPDTPEWQNGSFKGLHARGGISVDCEWRDGKVTSYKLHGNGGKTVSVSVNGRVESAKAEA